MFSQDSGVRIFSGFILLHKACLETVHLGIVYKTTIIVSVLGVCLCQFYIVLQLWKDCIYKN